MFWILPRLVNSYKVANCILKTICCLLTRNLGQLLKLKDIKRKMKKLYDGINSYNFRLKKCKFDIFLYVKPGVGLVGIVIILYFLWKISISIFVQQSFNANITAGILSAAGRPPMNYIDLSWVDPLKETKCNTITTDQAVYHIAVNINPRGIKKQ